MEIETESKSQIIQNFINRTTNKIEEISKEYNLIKKEIPETNNDIKKLQKNLFKILHSNFKDILNIPKLKELFKKPESKLKITETKVPLISSIPSKKYYI